MISKNANNRLALKLGGLAVAMFGFGYALVPLYDVFCDITGLNGKTGRVRAEDVNVDRVTGERVITVEFDTNTNGALPWSFEAKQRRVKVHPGEIGEALFSVENKAGHSIVGRAVPSVAPTQASVYFNKTECFCFTQQTLAAKEKRDMPVRFVVDPAIPEDIEVLTLSYTFFEAPEQNVETAGRRRDNKDNNS